MAHDIVDKILDKLKKDMLYYLATDTFEHSVRVAENSFTRLHEIKFYFIGLMHDLFEDSNLPMDDLKNNYKEMFSQFNKQFASEVIEAVDTLTRRKDEKYFDYINRVKLHEDARMVKFFDLQDNLMRCMIYGEKGNLKHRYLKALKILMEKN